MTNNKNQQTKQKVQWKQQQTDIHSCIRSVDWMRKQNYVKMRTTFRFFSVSYSAIEWIFWVCVRACVRACFVGFIFHTIFAICMYILQCTMFVCMRFNFRSTRSVYYAMVAFFLKYLDWPVNCGPFFCNHETLERWRAHQFCFFFLYVSFCFLIHYRSSTNVCAPHTHTTYSISKHFKEWPKACMLFVWLRLKCAKIIVYVINVLKVCRACIRFQ